MINARGVCKAYGDFHALNGLNINVEKGSIYGLIGVNGSGKTTLIKLLTGILRPDSGEITMDGMDVYDNEAVKERLGYIPDELYFYSSYSLKNMADYYRGLYKDWDDARFSRMVEDFELPLTGRISKFSKGMQKQAAFILVMSHHPDFLVLDEPIDGLDPIVRKKVWAYVVEDVAEKGMTVLVSSHNLREMEGICDSVGILSGGKMMIEKNLDDLISDINKIQIAFPQGSNKADYLKNLHILHHETRGSLDLIIARNSEDDIRTALSPADPVVLDILPLSLEEVFIYEMGGENSDIKEILR